MLLEPLYFRLGLSDYCPFATWFSWLRFWHGLVIFRDYFFIELAESPGVKLVCSLLLQVCQETAHRILDVGGESPALVFRMWAVGRAQQILTELVGIGALK